MKRSIILAVVVIVILVSSIGLSYYLFTGSQTFALTVTPQQVRGESIAGEYLVFLVTVSANQTGQDVSGIRISAVANGSAIQVQPTTISEGQVAEVSIVPDVSAVGKNISVTVTAESRSFTVSKTVSFAVAQGEDSLGEYARQIRDRFVQWLEMNHPELQITNETQWQGTIVSPVWLVVSHYLFYSKDWEMHVYWHVMIPPYDWARIDLRHRFTEIAPSLSFEISSLNSSLTPVQIPAPESVWR
ncbi:MAG: hypothetical protein M1587_02950 [Thaumarchaeota archaeon]|nr:hypothetical protein [Nitrososphaerota archaeon]MDG6906131.1 hypothetical protein [Nitrososphaerota archaeon]